MSLNKIFKMSGKIVTKHCAVKYFVGVGDLTFPRVDLKMDYTTSWSRQMTDRQLINVTNC